MPAHIYRATLLALSGNNILGMDCLIRQYAPTYRLNPRLRQPHKQCADIRTAQKNEKVNESFLSPRFRNIARMAPDVLDVIVASLANPLAGLGVAVKKIAEKAKEEAK